jgi:isopentenyl diphosphate isomerase/L-lactate dehydrogenase-like FMN-dependent dehydrogenase
MAGRAPLYGLATAGEAGVTHALGLLKQELDRSLAYLGCAKVDDLGPHLIADLPVQGDRRRP